MHKLRRICFVIAAVCIFGAPRASATDVFLGDDKESNVGNVAVVEVGSDPITLYDGSAVNSKPAGYSDYATGVCFKTDPGTKLSLVFDEFDIKGANVYIYSKKVDAIEYDYDYDWEEYSYTTPSGWDVYYYSTKKPTIGEPITSETGYITVVWKPSSASMSGNGIKCTVTKEEAGDMELKSAELFSVSPSVMSGETDAPLYGLRINTAKAQNPLSITSLNYSTDAMGTSVGNVRLCTLTDGVYTPVEPAGYQLKSGRNELYFIGDIDVSASDAIQSVTISSLTVGDIQAEVTTADAGNIAVSTELLMPADNSWPVVKIATPRNFYDAGGASAKIPLKTEGTFTFIPADPAKKIKLDFSSFEIFIASIESNSDKFCIYNGRTTSGTPVFSTPDTPGIIKSTADDGSLTVWFKGNAPTEYISKDGWAATVSQFEESAMSVTGVDAEAATTEALTVTEYQTDVPVAYFNVTTDGALDPKKLTSIRVNANSSMAGAASLYALGSKLDKTAVKEASRIGHAELTAADTDITADYTLADGPNWFAVTMDVAGGAENDATSSLTLSEVTAGGQTFALETPVTISATVKNECQLTEGTHSHTVSSSWIFTDEPYAYDSNKYAPGSSDRVVTFYPASPDGKIELNISEFALYYASQSYGTRARFEVRSGNRNGSVLWQLNSVAQATTGPGVPLKSTADDGSLTVIFSPETSSTGYCKKGWTAEVRQTISKPMTIDAVEVAQSHEGVTGVAAGTTGHRLLDINVAASGDQQPISVKGLKLTLTGVEALAAVHLLSSGASRDFATATEIGSLAAPLGAEVTIPCDLTLTASDNRLWVTVDLPQEVDSDIAIDAAATALVLDNDATYTIAEGNPEGHSVTQNVYIMESGEKVVTVSRTLQFYDDGGPDGNISMNFRGTVTFVPAREGECVLINTTEDGFGLGSHTMSIYNGRTISEETLIDSYKGLHGPENVMSTADDGSLTVVVKTQGSPSVAGFHVQVEPYKMKDLVAEAPVAQNAGSNYVMRGAVNSPLICGKMEVKGQINPIKVTGASAHITAPEGAVTRTALYVTTADHFVADNLISEGTTGENGAVTFSSATGYEIAQAGTYYLWITADIDAATAAGSKISTELTDVTVGGASLAVAEGNPQEVDVRAGLSGTYTLGKDGDYATFNAAQKALGDGIEGPVTFEVLDGRYPENIILSDIRGTSETNRITFRSQSGNRAAVVISGSMPSASNDEYGTHKEGMVLVQRTSNVTFEGMTFQPTQGMEYPSVMNIYDSSANVTVNNCAFSAVQFYDPTKVGPKLIYVESPTEENHTCDNFTVTDSEFTGGHCALSLQGSGYVSHRYLQGMLVEGNTIRNAYFQGIYANTVDGLVIRNNTIENRNNMKDDYRGIDIFKAGFTIEGNRIIASSEDYTSLRGINIRKDGGGTASAPGIIRNNVVALPDGRQDFHHGLDFDATTKYVKVLHNTVVVNGTGGYAVGIEGNPASSQGMEFASNLFQNFTGNAAMHFSYPEYATDIFAKMTWRTNCYYGSAVEVSSGVDLDGYAGASGDETSYLQQIEFASATNLRPMTDSDALRVARNPEVLTDADGRERSATTSRGAYQYRPMSTDAPVIAQGYPQVKGATTSSATVAVKWNVPGDLYSMILASDKPAPTADEVLAGEYREIEGDTEVLVTIDNLNENAAYRMYFVLSTVLGGNSAVVASETVRTLRNYDPLRVTLDATDATVNAGESASFTVTATGGDDESPYTYVWYDQMMQQVGADATLTVSPEAATLYRVAVTSGDNQTAWAKARVRVTGVELTPATFDDLWLDSESSWRWDRNIAGDADTFFSGSFEFVNVDLREYNTWSGFGYANETAAEYTDYGNIMRNAAGAGAAGTAAYGVCNPYGMSEYSATLTNSAEGETVPGVYVTSSAMTLYSVLNGDGLNPAFADGDYFELQIDGYDASGVRTGSVVVPLADYRGGKQETLAEWRYVNLKTLGQVKTLKFNSYCSQPNLTGLFCIDELGAKDPAEVALGLNGYDGAALRLVSDGVLAARSASASLLRIWSASGVCVAEHNVEGSVAVSVASLTPGVYVARLGSATLSFTKR